MKKSASGSPDGTLAALRRELEQARRSLTLQQKQLERARLDAEQDRARYQELFELAPEAYLVTDLYGAIIESNNGAASLLNTSRAALKRKPLTVYIHRDELRPFLTRLFAVREGGAPAAFLVRLLPRASDPLKVLASVTRSTGSTPHDTLRWILRDVTEHEAQREEIERLNRELEIRVEQRTRELRQSLEALAKSEGRLAKALDIHTVGVIFFDSSNRITDCNDAFLRMAGFSREEFESGALRWDKVTPRDWVETAASAGTGLPDLGEGESYEREYLHKDGSRWWGLVAAQWLTPQEGVEFVLDITDRKRTEAELVNSQRLVEADNSRRHLRRQLLLAEEQQRKRLARDLHDQLGQHLTAFSLVLKQTGDDISDNPPAQQRLVQLSDLASVMTRDARALALELRPPELDDVGLVSAVETYLAGWTVRYGIPVDVELANLEGDAIPAEAAIVIYRIIQEAMTNVARHAQSSSVSVILERPDGHINLIVEDDGKGFDVKHAGTRAMSDQRFGLAGMHERVDLAGGVLTVESSPGHGTTVFARVPLEERSSVPERAAETKP